MKIFRLSTAAERIAGLGICAALLLCMALLVMALSADVLSFIICLLCCLLVAAGLGFYVVNLFKAACVVRDPGKKLEVRGFPDYTADLSGAVMLETAAYKNGPMVTRTLLFTDEKGEVVTAIPTFFTANQGAQAEPLAMELADALGLAFHATLEPWEYDKEKRKEHQRELAEAEKAARREKFRALKAKILRLTGAGSPAPANTEEDTYDAADLEEEISDGVNYDALDDDK